MGVRRSAAMAGTAATAIAVAVPLLWDRASTATEPAEPSSTQASRQQGRALYPEARRASVRGCRERVEGARIVPNRQRATVIGSPAFIRPATRCPSPAPRAHPRGVRVGCSRRSEADFPGAFAQRRNLVVGPLVLVGGGERQRESVILEFGGQKFPLLVKAGHTVTVRVARRARRFAGLAYGGLGKRPLPKGEVRFRDTAKTMTFVACRRRQPSGSRVDGEPVTFWSGFVVMRTPACVPLEIYVDDESRARHAVLDMGGRRCRR